MRKQLGWILAAVALLALLGGCAAPTKTAGNPCAYPAPHQGNC
jgi:hypothetical protein